MLAGGRKLANDRERGVTHETHVRPEKRTCRIVSWATLEMNVGMQSSEFGLGVVRIDWREFIGDLVVNALGGGDEHRVEKHDWGEEGTNMM